MAQLILQVGGGAPSATLDLGTDEEALTTMRETLASDPPITPSVDVPPEDGVIPGPPDWNTTPDQEVVEAYLQKIFSDGEHRRARGLRLGGGS